MVATRTTNNTKNIFVVDVNKIMNNVSQKCPTMVQVTMSQKKAKDVTDKEIQLQARELKVKVFK